MLGGCSSKGYVTPDHGVLAGIDDADIEELFSKKPASPFPAQLSIVRVASTYRDGFEVVQTRDIESDADLARITEQPLVSQAAPLSRLLVPNDMKSLKDLRLPAAHMRSDLLLVYTVDTTFYVDSTPLGPLTAVSLGFLPNHQAHVTSTVAGILVDAQRLHLRLHRGHRPGRTTLQHLVHRRRGDRVEEPRREGRLRPLQRRLPGVLEGCDGEVRQERAGGHGGVILPR